VGAGKITLLWLLAGLGGGCALGRGADGGFADENGTSLDGEGLGLDVAYDFGAGLEFNAVGGIDVAMHLAINDDGVGLDLRLDAGVFADGEIAVGLDFTFDFPVNHEVVGEFDGAFDFHVGGKHVAGGRRRWAGCRGGRLLRPVGRWRWR